MRSHFLPRSFHSFQAGLTVVTLTHLLLQELQARLLLAQIVTTLTHLLLQELQARLLLAQIVTTLTHFPLPRQGRSLSVVAALKPQLGRYLALCHS
jgi:hypothetical protein